MAIDYGTDHGPKMKALTAKERTLVHYFIRQAERDYNAAFAKANFGLNPKNGSQKSSITWAIMHSDRMQDAILEECQRLTRGFLPMSLRVLAEIVENPQCATGDRIRAARLIIERSGLNAVTEQHHFSDNRPLQDDPQKIERIRVLGKQLGIPVEEIIGRRLARLNPPEKPITIDVDFEDAPEPSEAGLEGMI